MDAQKIAFIVGIIIGSLAVLSACFVWLRHRQFGGGGTVLSLVGVALIGLSIWSSISISISKERIEAKFDTIEKQVASVVEASETVTEQVQKIAESAETNRAQFISLTQSLEAKQTLDTHAASAIRREITSAPKVDTEQLNLAVRRLRELQVTAPPIQEP